MSVSALFLLVLVGLNCVWARTTLNPGKGALTPANCGRKNANDRDNGFTHGALTKGSLSTFDILTKEACFVKKQIVILLKRS